MHKELGKSEIAKMRLIKIVKKTIYNTSSTRKENDNDLTT